MKGVFFGIIGGFGIIFFGVFRIGGLGRFPDRGFGILGILCRLRVFRWFILGFSLRFFRSRASYTISPWLDWPKS